MPCKEENADYSRSRVLGENTRGNGRLCIKLKIFKAESDQLEHEHPPAAAKCFPRIKADPFDHEGVEEQASAPAKQFPLVCKICNKVFGSGKALGGHTIMHVQARNKELLEKIQKSKFKKHPTSAGDLSNAIRAKANANVAIMGEPTCYVCGKKFPAMKALFGHMRSHPGREWRGVLPPPTEKNSASSSSSTPSDDKNIASAAANFTTTEAPVLVDLSASLFRWKSTGKRGRRSIPASTSGYGSGLPQGQEEEGMQEAIHDLMMLANANPEKRLMDNSDPKAANIDSALTDSWNFPSRNDKLIRTDEAGSRREVLYKSINEDKGKGKAMLETAPPKMRTKLWVNEDWPRNYYYRDETTAHKDLNRNDSGNGDLVPKDEISVKMMTRNRKKRKTKLLGLKALGDAADRSHNQFPLTPSRYTCSLCNKSFPTHQALGGHMSSHNKLKYIQTMNEYVSANDSATEDYGNCANLITQVDGTETVLAGSKHQRKICNVETFPTGQALGGHKGSHWTGPVEIDSKAKAQSSQITSPGEASQTGRRILGFDLNDLPAMEV
ncbi:hypothetical protein CIPAW_11G210700 [Carya illinoinensis]|uniref:C2H2-type domain-containing protein n=1 Tax=Carya illinoinensis TaxID=32201 RepID=A0A8T1PAU9_CARIL|nr:hypothetical protein CIPAW_11G210700 [Carya illinoinensis]KAG6690125.1 hypothetical protein I3842_11G207500 [Carya illinoinensis]